MEPLSHDLVSFILSHTHFGSHSKYLRVTINVDLGKWNFLKGEHILAKTWNQTVIDAFLRYEKYINPLTISEDEYHAWSFTRVSLKLFLFNELRRNFVKSSY